MLVIDDMAPGLVIDQFIPVGHCFAVVTCVNQIYGAHWSGEHLQAFDFNDCEVLIKGRADQDICRALKLDPGSVQLDQGAVDEAVKFLVGSNQPGNDLVQVCGGNTFNILYA